ncbi:hypothetical protein K7432_017915 [Basidiobolus ranarum]|uniref:Uncharacterized protein n=1 Tax=Basidiobolus ranarum TaxID=34480 RepID=A0ABR2VJZ8_9FUNG
MIEHKIFRSQNGDALTYLSTIIKARIPSLQDTVIPDAWVYWPINAGGLGLKNPFIEILALRKALERTGSSDGFSQLPEEDVKLYDQQKKAYDKARQLVYRYKDSAWDALEGEHSREKRKLVSTLVEEQDQERNKVRRLLSFDEYCEGREFRLVQWFQMYRKLLTLTYPEPPVFSKEVTANIYRLKGHMDSSFPGAKSAYWEWIVCHYGQRFLDSFGSLHLMSTELVPKGMISKLKSSKVKFEG